MNGINDINKTGAIKPHAPASADQAGKVEDQDLFKKTFDKILSNSENQNQAPSSQAISGLGEIPSYGLMIENEGVNPVEKNTDQLLTLLDQYSRDLSDPTKSLKDIEPLVKDLKMEADLLSETVKNDDQSSPVLKTLAEQSAVLANVEYEKFIRGDYV